MTFKTHQSKFRTIRSTDPEFVMYDGIVQAQRAGFEIDPRCPKEYRMIIDQCLRYGWIKPVATVYGKELTMDALR